MEELFGMKAGVPVALFDLTGKDKDKLMNCINEFDNATEELLEGKNEKEALYKYNFYYHQLYKFAQTNKHFLCGSLPDKEGHVMSHFFFVARKEEERLQKERNINLWRKGN